MFQISKENAYEFLVNFSDGAIHKLGVDPSASLFRLGTDPATGEIVTRQVCSNFVIFTLDHLKKVYKYGVSLFIRQDFPFQNNVKILT